MRGFILVLALLTILSAANGQLFDPARGELRFVVFNDFNSSYGQTSYVPAVLQAVELIGEVWLPDLVLGAGDLVAGQSRLLPDDSFEEMWAAFDRYIAEPLRRAGIPYAFAMGNHDASSLRRADGAYLFRREREAARSYWQQPMYHTNLAYLDRSDFPFHYSFTFGPVFIAVWDASSAQLKPEQLTWLEQELSRPEAAGAALRLVMGHLPLYGVAVGRNLAGEVLPDGDAIRDLLESHAVDTYISGHHHAYYPGRRGALNLLNTGGVGPRPLLGAPLRSRTTLTLMDIDLEPVQVRYTTFDIATWRVIDIEDLPEHIDGVGGTIRRMDLDP